MIATILLERGMPSRVVSSGQLDYVPAICTHRPSLLPIGSRIEALGGAGFELRFCSAPNSVNILVLEEAKAVTRLL